MSTLAIIALVTVIGGGLFYDHPQPSPAIQFAQPEVREAVPVAREENREYRDDEIEKTLDPFEELVRDLVHGDGLKE